MIVAAEQDDFERGNKRKMMKKRKLASDDEEEQSDVQEQPEVKSQKPDVQGQEIPAGEGDEDFGDQDFDEAKMSQFGDMENLDLAQLEAKIKQAQAQVQKGNKRNEKKLQKEEAARAKAAAQEQEMAIPALRALQRKKRAHQENDEEIKDNALKLVAMMKSAFEKDNQCN